MVFSSVDLDADGDGLCDATGTQVELDSDCDGVEDGAVEDVDGDGVKLLKIVITTKMWELWPTMRIAMGWLQQMIVMMQTTPMQHDGTVTKTERQLKTAMMRMLSRFPFGRR